MIQIKKMFACTTIMGLLALGAFGCARVQYGSPGEVETLTQEFGSTDLQTIAEKMVNSMLLSPVIGADRPVIYVSQIKNKTAEHIDTKSITDKISTAMLKSGKVRFTAAGEINKDLLEQLEYQENTGLVDPKTRKKIGRQIGADYMIYGEITSITKKAGRKTDSVLSFSLKYD